MNDHKNYWENDPVHLNSILEQINNSPAGIGNLMTIPGLNIPGLNKLLGFPEHKLFVYGSLQPGRENHHMLSDVKGEWMKGYVTGDLINQGWGADMGYPAMIWNPDGEKINGQLLISKELLNHWQRLDELEGKDYKRILIPVFCDKKIQVAHIYSASISNFPQ
ncbi:gamma-glutamylcyclotransferase family protein [Flavitalea flava]